MKARNTIGRIVLLTVCGGWTYWTVIYLETLVA